MTELDIIADITARAGILIDCLRNCLDREQEVARPFFYYHVSTPKPVAYHSFWDISDMVFRGADALLKLARITKKEEAEEAASWLLPLVEGCLDRGNGLNFRMADKHYSKDYVMTHDLGRGLLGTTAFLRYGGVSRMRDRLSRFLDRVEELYKEGRGASSYLIDANGFTPYEGEVCQPVTSGRLVWPLVEYFKATGDERALPLLDNLIKVNLDTSFNEDGTIKPTAGKHFHSVSGLITGIAMFASIISDRALLERARLIFDRGLVPEGSSWGWFTERVGGDLHEGEGCCTADMIQGAITFGKAGFPEYFEKAECWLRNGLFGGQVVDTSWFGKTPSKIMPSNHMMPVDMISAPYELSVEEAKEKVRGIIYGFGGPAEFISEYRACEFQMCCSAQGADAIYDAWEAVITRDALGDKVNLLLTREDDRLSIESEIPFAGKISLMAKMDGVLPLVRLPNWVDKKAMSVKIGEKKVNYFQAGAYLGTRRLTSGERFTIEFPLPRREGKEVIQGRTYNVKWVGNTVIEVTPEKGELFAPYFGGRKL